MSNLRLLAATAGLSLLLAAGGLLRETVRFGGSDIAAAGRVAAELERRVAERARALQAAAARVARSGAVVASAESSRDRLPDLFERLAAAQSSDQDAISSTVWVSTGPAGGYRALAWSDGPAGHLSNDILARAPALTIAPDAGGLRLVVVAPIEVDGKRVGIASAETQLAGPPSATARTSLYVVMTSLGPVSVTPLSRGTPPPAPGRFVVSDPGGTPLFAGEVSPGQAIETRRIFRWRAAALCLAPWLAWMLAAALQLLDRRTGKPLGWWLIWSVVSVSTLAGVAVLMIWLARRAGVGPPWQMLTLSLAAVATAAILPGGAWWRKWRRQQAWRARARWSIEQLTGGVAIATGAGAMAWLWRLQVGGPSAERWHLPLLGADIPSVATLTAVLLAQIAISWTIAGLLGSLAARWGLSWRVGAGWLAGALWAAPAVLAVIATDLLASADAVGILTVVGGAVAFGLSSLPFRRHYRGTSEARRLVMRFGALLLPVLIAYPLAADSTDKLVRRAIEQEYAPATLRAQEPATLRAILVRSEGEIDRVAGLEALLAKPVGGRVTSQAAFTAWRQTVLATDRVTSEIELYGHDRTLVSRFSLNVPEFGGLYETGELAWQGTGCTWAEFAEVARFGAGERRMLHAERGVCDEHGHLLGAIVLHLIPDYRALSFVSSANPYYEALGAAQPSNETARMADLHLVVYGWSLQPVFVSGRVAWPLDEQIDRRLYESRAPFWRDRETAGRRYHVYFLNDRAGVYALGYPVPTMLQHATRLAEAAAVLAVLFVLHLTLAAVWGPVLRRRPAALRQLFREIRASFYRKLFLFFVLAAVGPVVLFAIAFGAYMTANLRADVEFEASSVAAVGRRVFDELSAAQARPGQARPSAHDDVMVWIRQMIDQDVNLYEGAELLATSQRDLFDSGLLPTRTPAAIYREVVVGRRPVAVAEDRIGAFRYLVAAAPVPQLGREAVLTVPLAPRQREIEREIDELTRGVLAGTVVLVLFAAALGASVAARVSDPVARLTRATRLIAAGRLDERLVADSADELGRLVDDFNTMTRMLAAQRAELARANQLKAWAEMSRQVAHEVKNPLTPIQLAAEHLQRVHQDRNRPLGPVFDQCLATILKQVRLLRRIASEFSTFASQPVPRTESIPPAELLESVVEPYRLGLPPTVTVDVAVPAQCPDLRGDRILLARALTNLVENAIQAMPNGGRLNISASSEQDTVVLVFTDTGVGMDSEAVSRAFEPYFSTKTGGSGLGLANARRNIELCGGTVTISSQLGVGTTVTIMLPAARHDAPEVG